MKTLIPLMLLCLGCLTLNAQNYKKMTAKIWADSSYGDRLTGTYDQYVYTPSCVWNYQPEKEIMTGVLGDLLKEYIQYCYNDSTLLKHQHFMPKGERFCIMDRECLNPSHYHDVWIHKEPTFIGFSQWINNN